MFEFDEALFVFEYATPAFAFALLFDRPSTRPMGFSTFPRFALSSLRFVLYLINVLQGDFFKPPPLYAFQGNSSSFAISPKKQSRPPQNVYEYDEALFVLEYATPAYASALLFDRPSTRPREL